MANRKFYHKSKKRPEAGTTATSLAYTAEQLGMTLEALGISEGVQALLTKNNILTARDLVVRSEKDMYRVQGFNKKALIEVKKALEKAGMTLRAEAPKPAESSEKQPEKQPAQQRNGEKAPTQQKTSKPQSGRFGLADGDTRSHAPQGDKNRQKSGQKGAQPQPHERDHERVVVRGPLPVEQWRKIIKGGKWGFSDGVKTVIAPQYDEVFCFKEGLASVELDGKCGYIDSENNVVIPFDYDTAMSFSEGLAMVVKGDKCGYIDKNNVVVFGFEYDAATAFEDGEAKVKKDGKWATLTLNGELTFI